MALIHEQEVPASNYIRAQREYQRKPATRAPPPPPAPPANFGRRRRCWHSLHLPGVTVIFQVLWNSIMYDPNTGCVFTTSSVIV
jgi:hypothetical protein